MSDPATAPALNRIHDLPVTFFTIVMGLVGFTLSLGAVERALGLTSVMSDVALAVTALVFMMIALAYLLKLIRYPAAAKGEWNHPIKLAFFPAISISMLLLSAALLDHSEPLARGLWLIAVALQAALTIAVISSWISTRSFQHGHLTPAWFIPAVGNVIAPIAGAQLGYIELSWFFMSAGLIFWLVLLTLVMNRLIFHDPLPERLQPTLVILIAPPAVGFLSWVQLTGEVEVMGRILLNSAYLFTLIVAVQIPRILRVPFSLSFWALSFPFAAVTTASLSYAALTGSWAHKAIGLALFAVLCTIIAGLLVKTLPALRSGAAFEAG